MKTERCDPHSLTSEPESVSPTVAPATSCASGARLLCLKADPAPPFIQSMTRLLALLALVLSACAGSAPSLDATEETAPLAVAVEPEPVCAVTFTPDPELEAETRDAAARWSAATGCAVTVGEGGIRVRLVEDRMITPSGTEAHGQTFCPSDSCRRSELVIEVARDHAEMTVAHEMGHALEASTAHVDDDGSLMAHTGGNGDITAADLTLVCSVLDCTVFTPEG